MKRKREQNVEAAKDKMNDHRSLSFRRCTLHDTTAMSAPETSSAPETVVTPTGATEEKPCDLATLKTFEFDRVLSEGEWPGILILRRVGILWIPGARSRTAQRPT